METSSQHDNSTSHEPDRHSPDSDESKSSKPLPSKNTEGGAVVGGNVSVQGGDFVGRDKITITEETAYDAELGR